MKTLDRNRKSVMPCKISVVKRRYYGPWLTMNGYSLVDSSVDIREGYSGELQM
jgi:hypothetical protein